MDDLATLAIRIEASQVKDAATALDHLADRSKKVDGAINEVGKTSRKTASELGLLKTAAGALFGGLSIKLLMNTADAFSDISARVNLAAGSLEKGNAVMDRLSEISRNTYSSLGQTAEGYLANAASMRELGYSTRQVLDYTSALNNAMVISGAKAERAAQVQHALAKAMALGKLSGENLNTVIQNGGEVATLLAARFNTTTGGLLKLGQQGKITGDILVDTLIKAMEDLEERAGSMPATISDGFTLIGSSFLKLVGVYDQAGKVSETFAERLVWVADNLQTVLTVGLSLAAAFGGAYVYSMYAARAATIGVATSLVMLRSALITTGIGAAAVGVGLLIDQFIKLTEKVGGVGKLFGLIGDVGKEVFERISLSGQSAGAGLAALWKQIEQGFLRMLATLMEKWADFLHNLASSMSKIPGMTEVGFSIRDKAIEAGTAFYGLDNAANNAGNSVQELNKLYEDLGAQANAPLQSLQALRDVMNGNGESSVDLEDKLKRVNVAANDNSKAAAKMKKAWDDLLRGAKDRVAQMELEAQLVGKNTIEAEVLRIKLEALQEAEKKGLKLKPEQIAMLNELADKYGVLASKVAEYQLMADAAFEREQMFRSPIDQRIMQDLKMAGIEIDSIAGQTYASFVKTTDQIGLAKDATRDFAGSLVSDLLQGKSTLDSLTSALGKLGDKLIQLALDEAINGLFGNLFGLVGGGGSGFGAGYFPPAPSMGGGGIGLFAAGGISDKPAIFGEAGPEAAVPLPDGRTIPVTLSGNVGGGGSEYVDNRVYNFTGTSEEFQQFKAYVAEQERNFDARAVGAIREAEQSNYKFGT